jgi:ribonuclease P protein component
MKRNEENLPAEYKKESQDPRIPCPNEDDGWSECAEKAQGPRTTPTRRVNGLSRARFDEVFQKGRRMNGEFVRLFVLPAPDHQATCPNGRLGVAASKSIGCHARRTKVKRRLREAFWSLGGLPGHDCVLVGKEKASGSVFASLVKDAERLIQQVVVHESSAAESP